MFGLETKASSWNCMQIGKIKEEQVLKDELSFRSTAGISFIPVLLITFGMEESKLIVRRITRMEGNRDSKKDK